jgi:hypothetical protein
MSQSPEAAAGTAPGSAPKKCRRKKILAAIAAAPILGLVIATFAAGPIVRGQVEKIGTEKLGVPVTLDSLSIGLFSGSASIGTLTVAQPEGFGTEPLFRLGGVEANVSLSALLSGRVEVTEFTVREPAVNLVRSADGRLNYQVLRENLTRAPAPAERPPAPPRDEPAPAPAPAKPFLLKALTVSRTSVTLTDLGSQEKASLGIATIGLQDFAMNDPERAKDPVRLRIEGFELAGPWEFGKGTPLLSFGALEVARVVASLDGEQPHLTEVSLSGLKALVSKNKAGETNGSALAALGQRFAVEEKEDSGAAAPASGTDRQAPQRGERDRTDTAAPPKPFRIDNLAFKDLVLTYLEPDQQPIVITLANLTATNLTRPQIPGASTTIDATVRMLESEVTAKIAGLLLEQDAAKTDATFDVAVRRLPLAPLTERAGGNIQFESGLLSVTTKGTVAKKKLLADITITGQDLKLAGSKKGGIAGLVDLSAGRTGVATAIEMIRKPNSRDTVPVEFPLEVDLSTGKPARKVALAVLDGFLGAARKASAQKLVDGVSDVGEGVAGAAGTVGGAAADAAKGVTGAIGGILGGGRKDEKEGKEREKERKKKD